MSINDSWLIGLVPLVAASLFAAVYIAGLVMTLLRWHEGMASRMAAIGFGLMLVSAIAGQAARLLIPSISAESFFVWMMVITSAQTLGMLTAWILILLALRSALNDAAASRAGLPADR